MYEELKKQAVQAAEEIIAAAKLEEGDVLVVGCSSSEICGQKIGSDSNEDVARAVFAGIWETAKAHKVWLAAQCCEHLNRAIIMEAACAKQYGLPRVNVVPQKKAGGSFATAAYANFEKPVAIEEMRIARAGLDIGDTFIGMHLKRVAVPVRLIHHEIGQAHISAARVRPKFIGGSRAVYDESLIH